MQTQDLLKRELSIYFNHPAICTVTFFEGSISVAETHFQSRFSQVLKANPWLGGKLVISGNEQKLVYCTETQLNDVLSVITTAIAISPQTEYETLIKTCSPFSLGGDGNLNGHKLLKAGAPVCRLTIAPTKRPSQFLVLFSLSHAIADGYTYYEILNMLTDSADVSVRALNPQRKMEYQQLLPTLISPPILKFGSSLTFLKAYLMGMFRKPASRALAYYVEEVKVEEAKKSCTTGFISTNDILTSHYMNACAPIRLGMMTINYRPRCSILNNNDAGNYEEIVLSDKGGHKTPESVRKSLIPNAQGLIRIFVCAHDSNSFYLNLNLNLKGRLSVSLSHYLDSSANVHSRSFLAGPSKEPIDRLIWSLQSNNCIYQFYFSGCRLQNVPWIWPLFFVQRQKSLLFFILQNSVHQLNLKAQMQVFWASPSVRTCFPFLTIASKIRKNNQRK